MAIFVMKINGEKERPVHFMDGKNRKAGDYIRRYGVIIEVLCGDNCGQKNPGEKTKFRECFLDHNCTKLEELWDGYKNQTKQRRKHSK